jgi:predicted aspartyl protease
MGTALASLALAGEIPTVPPIPPVPSLYESATREDRIGRILVPVEINHRGPFQFLLDTGANRTVITPRLAAQLSLKVIEGRTVVLSGVTGSARVPTVAVAQVKAGDIALHGQLLPVADTLSSDADGILGVDALKGTRIVIDFTNDKVSIKKAHRETVLDGLTRIPAQFRFGRLLTVRATVDRIPVKAIIDTGSARTLGNAALLAKLDSRIRQPEIHPLVEVIGETLARQSGEPRRVRIIRMGTFQAVGPTVVFGNFYVFRLWGLESEPSLLLGMDMLGSLDKLLIDYQRSEIQLSAHR